MRQGESINEMVCFKESENHRVLFFCQPGDIRVPGLGRTVPFVRRVESYTNSIVKKKSSFRLRLDAPYGRNYSVPADCAIWADANDCSARNMRADFLHCDLVFDSVLC